jgi:urease accessory protein
MQGLLSGLGHPIIGLDHLAAVVAVGCLAALAGRGMVLIAGYVLALIAGAALHLRGATLPAVELLVALSVVLLGALMLWRQPRNVAALAALFALTGLLHGYALGESIIGAEPTPLLSYFVGFAVMQLALAGAAMLLLRRVLAPAAANLLPLRLAGAAVALVGGIAFVLQLAA